MIAARTSAGVTRSAAAPRSRARTVTVRAASIVDTARSLGHTSFAAAVEKAGLTRVLNDSSATYTVFVPTNAVRRARAVLQAHQ